MNPEASKYLAAIGRRGGKAKTAAKSAAAIANGKLGGRPKKQKRAARRHNDEPGESSGRKGASNAS